MGSAGMPERTRDGTRQRQRSRRLEPGRLARRAQHASTATSRDAAKPSRAASQLHAGGRGDGPVAGSRLLQLRTTTTARRRVPHPAVGAPATYFAPVIVPPAVGLELLGKRCLELPGKGLEL